VPPRVEDLDPTGARLWQEDSGARDEGIIRILAEAVDLFEIEP
jgi:hypothetical protein